MTNTGENIPCENIKLEIGNVFVHCEVDSRLQRQRFQTRIQLVHLVQRWPELQPVNGCPKKYMWTVVSKYANLDLRKRGRKTKHQMLNTLTVSPTTCISALAERCNKTFLGKREENLHITVFALPATTNQFAVMLPFPKSFENASNSHTTSFRSLPHEHTNNCNLWNKLQRIYEDEQAHPH